MYCKYCGKEIADGIRFCVHCGKKLIDDAPTPTPTPTPTPEPQPAPAPKPQPSSNSINRTPLIKKYFTMAVGLAAAFWLIYAALLAIAHVSYSIEVKERYVSELKGLRSHTIDVEVYDNISHGELNLGFCHGFSNWDCDTFVEGYNKNFPAFTEENVAQLKNKAQKDYLDGNMAWLVLSLVLGGACFAIYRFLKRKGWLKPIES